MANIIEAQRSIPVLKTCEVLVVGGGIAGVAAALAAARRGSRVCLIEKTAAPGGLATLGNVAVYLPLCDGKGRQVIGGLGEELLRLSVRDQWEKVPACWEPEGKPQERQNKRLCVTFNPCSFLLEMEKALINAGVDILYDTLFCGVARERESIRAIFVESKSGRHAIACGAVVDATGDGDVCFHAGEPFASLDTNVAASWYYAWNESRLVLHKLSETFTDDGTLMPDQKHAYDATRPGDVTRHLIDSRELIRHDLEKARAEALGGKAFAISLPTVANFRMTRRLDGEVVLSEADQGKWFDDTIGLSGDWRKPGPVYAIPFRALAAVHTENLVAAGRCISTKGRAWDVLRAIPACVVTGQAAGMAAHLAVQEKQDVRKLPIETLQENLREQGVILDRNLVERKP
ncbi:FAD-dependent oxidoreductase [bacterium]|nr:FAD-dependent oxidoreductase [bacterium]